MARGTVFFLAALVVLPCALAAQQGRAPAAPVALARVALRPKFTPGLVMRYRMVLESTSTTRQNGLVQDPQGPRQLNITWESNVRIEVFPAAGSNSPRSVGAASSARPLRLRITYETSAAEIRSDTPEPLADQIQQQYAQLAGRSLEFTLTPSGEVSDVHGLEGFLADEKTRAAVQQWIVQLSASSTVPTAGVIPGQKWNFSQAADLPLAGLSWRTDATYLRNEPCRLANVSDAAARAAAASARADCAVIQSRLALITTRPVRDATPDEYRRNGLRTGGRWSGSGQSVMWVALDTGWVVSSTQENTQDMDVTIAEGADATANVVRHSGAVTTRSQVTLLTNDAAAPAAGASPAPVAR